MRSKEVDEYIKEFEKYIVTKRDETCWYHEETSTGDCFTCPNSCGESFIRGKRILNYISELEEKVNIIDTQFIHKDKVFELVEELNKQIDAYNDAIDKFNKLLEGE